MDTLDATSLPPGFGFHPTDVELISHYLRRKIMGYKTELEVIPVVDIYKYEPWDLPAKTRIPSRECKWHFFNTRDRKYPGSSRTNRATGAGYWKSTGKDRMIRARNQVIGTKKTLVFHEGRPPHGKRSDWIMHEYYLNESECKAMAAGTKEFFVLCRITKRDGMVCGKEEAHTDVQDMTSSCKKNSPRAQDVSEDLNFEAWVEELYDPEFFAVPASTDCKIELEEHLGSLTQINHLPYVYAENSLVTGTDTQLYNTQEVDEDLLRDLKYWSDMQEINNASCWGNIGDDIAAYRTPSSNMYLHNRDQYAEFEQAAFRGNADDNKETEIFIRQNEARSFENTPNRRIKMQVHKMESKNPVTTSHTVTLENNDHHLDINDAPPEPVVSDTKIKREIISEDPSPTTEVYGHYTSKRNQTERRGVSSRRRRLRSGVKGLVQRVFKESHILTGRRCSPMGSNCITACFLGLA